MTQQLIGIGSAPNDGNGDPLRIAFTKVNANETELYKGYNGSASKYISGRWYTPRGTVYYGAGTNGGVGSARFFPGFITDTITVDELFARITTSATGNIQFAIYANDPAANRPTGTPLATTASVSTNATSATGNLTSSVQLQPGMYWFGTNMDNATAVALSLAANAVSAGSYAVGGTTGFKVLESVAGLVGVSTPLTFGTWGDLTSAVWTEQQGQTVPAIAFHVASSP